MYGVVCSVPLTVQSRAFGTRQLHLTSVYTVILTTVQQEGRPLERHHCRLLHRWCSCRPWWLQGHAQRCHRLRHPARRHRGRRYRFPAHDGRKHQTRRSPTTSARHRGCSQGHGRLKERVLSITCAIYGYILAFGAKSIIFLDLGLSFLFSHSYTRPAPYEGDLSTLHSSKFMYNHPERKRPWWVNLVLQKDQICILMLHVIKNPLFINKIHHKFLCMSRTKLDTASMEKKVAESESPGFVLGAVDEVKGRMSSPPPHSPSLRTDCDVPCTLSCAIY